MDSLNVNQFELLDEIIDFYGLKLNGIPMKSKPKKQKTSTSNMQIIFLLVEAGLRKSGSLLGRTYNEMNVIVYYGIIPLSWVLMIDYILSIHWFTFGFSCFTLGVLAGCGRFSRLFDHIFDKSVKFLLSFNRVGSNYTATSVWVCVALPLAVYGILGYLTFLKLTTP
ncbi:MAG: hypothetical protein ACKPAD_15785 [Bacteroidota bacterium]